MSSHQITQNKVVTVEPVFPVENTKTRAVRWMPNLTIPAGQVVAEVTSTSQNTVQTINFSGGGAAPTGGTFTLHLVGVDDGLLYSTAALAWNISNANLKIAIDGLLAAAGYEDATVTLAGGAAPTDVVVTFGGSLAGYVPPQMTVTSALTGGAGAVAASLSTNLAGDNNDLVWTAKGTGPSGNLITVEYIDPAANDQALAVALVGNSIKVSLATGPGGAITSTATEIKAAAEAVAGVDAIVAIANKAANDGTGVVIVMVETALAGGVAADIVSVTIDATQTGFTAACWGKYDDTATDGRQQARGIVSRAFKTDAFGNVIGGTGVLPGLPMFGGTKRETEMIYIGGTWKTEELIGLDANAVTDLGRLTRGTLTKGELTLIG